MSKNVVIIGSGPAGMMAAITAASNGHRVTVLEKNEKPCKTKKTQQVLTNAVASALPFNQFGSSTISVLIL